MKEKKEIQESNSKNEKKKKVLGRKWLEKFQKAN